MSLGVQGVVSNTLLTLGEGATADLRQGKSGELWVQQLHGALYQVTRLGKVFLACNQAAGVDHGAAVDTAAPFALANPSNSGVNAVILELAMAYLSGTLGVGFVGICLNEAITTPITPGTSLTEVNALANSTAAGNVVAACEGATLPGVPSLVGLLGQLSSTISVVKKVDGGIILPPGAMLSLQAVGTAGTTPRVVFSAMWEEVPV